MNRIYLTALLAWTSLSFSAEYYIRTAAQCLANKNPDQALQLLQKATTLYPQHREAFVQCATTHYIMHHYDAAARYFEEAIALEPSNPNTHYNAASAYCKIGAFDKAINHFETAYKLSRDNQIMGNLFKLYVRSRAWEKASALNPSSLWWYDENIAGKTILIDVDKPGNGFGDSIQFMRYAHILAQAGARIIVKTSMVLKPLFDLAPFINTVITDADPIPAHDRSFSICIASLLNIMQHTIIPPAKAAYLWAAPELIEYWRKELARHHSFKIGLCWQSNFVKDLYTGAIAPSDRSIAVAELSPLIMIPGVSFYSLQKTEGAVEAPVNLTQFGADFDTVHGRFMDTAAVIMNMDLVITIDTSIAHLAAALGKPVWILLSCESDYRWFLQSDTSNFYPTARLFRQKSYGDWTPVIHEVIEALQKLTSQQ